ncbi:MAG: phosphoheptose isomerase family protein [Candidatus Latescibacterota bacterium]
MQRREAVKLIPLSLAGIAGLAAGARAKSPTPLALQFTANMREIFERIKHNQSEEILEAAHRVADTVKRGNKCYLSWDMGHRTEYDIFPDRPGDTDIFIKQLPKDAEKGDLIMTNAAASGEAVNRLLAQRDKGVVVISGPRSWGGDNLGNEQIVPEIRKLKVSAFADLWIELYETAYGAVVNVPGSPYPMGPSSGGVGVLSYWMVVADAARLLTAGGKTFNVYGDEPSNSGNAAAVNLNRPLGDVYYETALAGQKACENEMDRVRRMAEMALHTVLRGGRVFFYSRHEPFLCAECYARRGGLGLTYGVYGPPDKLTLFDDPIQQGKLDLQFRPTEKDVVIMGVVKPDDPDDLAALELFRKAGMGVAAIGPKTRGGVVPSGRTVPKEADVHAGDACDAYGLFSLPGISRRVCPTSGFVANQLLWMVCCEIAEQIIDRTGNVPGIYLNGAMKGGMDRLDEVKRLLKERGY